MPSPASPYYSSSSSSSSNVTLKTTMLSNFKLIILILLAIIIFLALYIHFSLYLTHQELKATDEEEHGPRNSRVIKKKFSNHHQHEKQKKHSNKKSTTSAPAAGDEEENEETQNKHHHDRKGKKHHPRRPHHQRHQKHDDEENEDDDDHIKDSNNHLQQKHESSSASSSSSSFTDDSPVQEVDMFHPITSLKQLRHSDTEFFVFVEERSGKYLARPLNTLTTRSKWKERIFRVQHSKKYSVNPNSPSFTIRGHTRLFLTSETNDRVTIDRLWARSYEQWHFDFSTAAEDGCIRLRANRNNKYVTVFKTDGSKSLETVVSDKMKAAKWKMYAVPKCGKQQKTNHEADDTDDDTAPNSPEVRCWGPDLSGYEKSRKKSRPGDANKLPPGGPLRGPLLDSPLHTPPHLLRAQFPLFGSPKPLKSSKPVDPHDHFDTVVIAERTIRNWASMDGMVPIMFSDDPATVDIVKRVNDDIEEHKDKLQKDGCVASSSYSSAIPRHLQKHKTRIEKEFEIQKRFKQPTYRGLFKKALELYPDAPAVMYSNGDILFSPTLAQTIRRVASYFETQKKVQPKLRGWMIVGQRVNCVVPAEFYLKDVDSDSDNDDDNEKRYFTCKDLKKMKEKIGLKDEEEDSSSSSSSLSLARNFSLTTMPQWVLDVENYARNGQLFQGNAEDYFIVSRDMFDWDKIPDFVVGGVAFDNWITGRGVHAALKGEAIMVDAVKTITALHQNDNDNVKTSHKHEKSRYNLELAASHGGIHDGYTADAPHATERLPDGTVTIYDKHALLFS